MHIIDTATRVTTATDLPRARWRTKSFVPRIIITAATPCRGGSNAPKYAQRPYARTRNRTRAHTNARRATSARLATTAFGDSGGRDQSKRCHARLRHRASRTPPPPRVVGTRRLVRCGGLSGRRGGGRPRSARLRSGRWRGWRGGEEEEKTEEGQVLIVDAFCSHPFCFFVLSLRRRLWSSSAPWACLLPRITRGLEWVLLCEPRAPNCVLLLCGMSTRPPRRPPPRAALPRTPCPHARPVTGASVRALARFTRAPRALASERANARARFFSREVRTKKQKAPS